MKILLAASAVALLAAGCATTEPPAQVAQAECKIVPATTESAAGARRGHMTPIEQREAEMALATSQYRMANLRRQGPALNNVEDALKDCR